MSKYPNTFCLLILFFLSPFITFSQEHRQKKLDSLSFDEIYSIWRSDNGNKYEKLFPLHLEKAKRDRDTFQLAQAYRMRAWELDYQRSIEYLDTALILANQIKEIEEYKRNDLLAGIYYSKAAKFYVNDKNEKAINGFIHCFKLAKKAENYDLVLASLSGIAEIKAFFGQENESILLLKNNIILLDRNRFRSSIYNEELLAQTSRLAGAFLHKKEADSGIKYIKKAMKIAIEINRRDYISDLKILEAKANFYLGNHVLAKKLFEGFRDKDTFTPDDLYYLGQIENKLGQTQLKRIYFKRIDSILQTQDYPLMDNINTIYQYLLQDAIQNNDTVLEREYFQRLVYYDTLLTNTQERLRAITLHEFDLPLELEEKQALTQNIQTKTNWLYIFYALSALLLCTGIAYFVKYQNTQRKLQYALNHPIELEPSPQKNVILIQDSKENETVLLSILTKLEQWEREKGFLDGALNQQDLAKQLDTNTAYLSQAINLYKGQNFSSYIKDLRITHAINVLKDNPEVAKNKSMIQLAELFGFNSTTVFNKAFKTKLGITPGMFLKELFKS